MSELSEAIKRGSARLAMNRIHGTFDCVTATMLEDIFQAMLPEAESNQPEELPKKLEYWVTDMIRNQNQRIGDIESKIGGVKAQRYQNLVDNVEQLKSRISQLEQLLNDHCIHATGEPACKPAAKADKFDPYDYSDEADPQSDGGKDTVNSEQVGTIEPVDLANAFPLDWRKKDLLELCHWIVKHMTTRNKDEVGIPREILTEGLRLWDEGLQRPYDHAKAFECADAIRKALSDDGKGKR